MAEGEQNGTVAPADPLVEEVASAIAEIDALELNPKVWAENRLMLSLTFAYPSIERRRQAVDTIRSERPAIVDALERHDHTGLLGLLNRMQFELQKLTGPVFQPSFADDVATMQEGFRFHSWDALEVDRLQFLLRETPQARLEAIDVDGVVLVDGRHITREQLRESLRTIPDQPREEVEATRGYQAMLRAYEDAKARQAARGTAQVERYSSGPSWIIGKPIK